MSLGYPFGDPMYTGCAAGQQYQQQQQPTNIPTGFTTQYMQRYDLYNRDSQHYGCYGSFYQNAFQTNAYQAYQFQSTNDLWELFSREIIKNPANAKRQALQAQDLCNILNTTPSIRNFYNINWSRELCSLMIAMLDKSQDGFMQYAEYLELQQCLVAWFHVFRQHDAECSGFIEAQELSRVVKGLFGYNISPQCLSSLLKRYSRVYPGPDGDRSLIAFDDFVAMCVRLRAYTDAFRQRDAQQHGRETGLCTFQYDDFLQCVLCL